MPASKRSVRAKTKAQHRKAREARRKDLDGVMWVKTFLPNALEVETRKRGIFRRRKAVGWRDLVLHTIDQSMTQLEQEGAALHELTVITLGTTNPAYPGEFVVEVKSREAAPAAPSDD